MNALFTVRHLSFAYPGTCSNVLKDLDLEISAGEPLSILGPNGCGKTTLLHILLGWLKPGRGEILLEGKSFNAYTRRELGQKLALVPQTEALAFEFSALEYVLFGRAPYLPPLASPGIADEEIARKAIARVGLEKLTDRSVLEMSGGERQLLLVARALAQEAKTILLDEASAHLDLGNKIELVSILKELANSGCNIIFTTHEPELALAMSATTLLMKDGKTLDYGPSSLVINSGALSQLYGKPIHVFSRDGKTTIQSYQS